MSNYTITVPIWIMFANKLLRVDNIDFFEMDVHDVKIQCTHHVGQSYQIETEVFNDTETKTQRMKFIRDQIGGKIYE